MTYTWKCKDTGKTVDIQRKISQSDDTPKWEDCEEQGWTKEEFDKVTVWVKVITGGIGTITFGQKGHWIILLGVLL